MSNKKRSTSKRNRCVNFSAFEENTLVALTIKRSDVLECKKSDHDIWEAKTVAWRQIQEEFIAATGNNREVQNLRDKYENLKRKTKKLEGDRKKYLFQTGGGASASCTVAPSATHYMLLGILGVSAVGLNNPFDGDKPGKPLIKTTEVETENDIVVVNNLSDDNLEYLDVNLESSDEMDLSVVAANITTNMGDTNLPVQPTWTKWNPEVLKTHKSAELITPLSNKKTFKTTLGESVKKYSQEKLELIVQQKRYFENEKRRAQEKHNSEQLRSQEKHEWERVHHKLT